MIKRTEIEQTMNKLTQILSSDEDVQGYGCIVNGIYGFPTTWKKTHENHFKMIKRGNLLKLPYLNQKDEIKCFNALIPMHFDKFKQFILLDEILEDAPFGKNTGIYTNHMRVTKNKNKDKNGYEKIACVDAMLRKNNGMTTLQEVLKKGNPYGQSRVLPGVPIESILKYRLSEVWYGCNSQSV